MPGQERHDSQSNVSFGLDIGASLWWARSDLLVGGGDQGSDDVGVELQQLASHQLAKERPVPGCGPADRGPTRRRRCQGHVCAVVLHREAAHHRVGEASGLVDLQDLLDARRAPAVTEPLDRALLRRAGGRWAVATVVPGAPVAIGTGGGSSPRCDADAAFHRVDRA